VFNTLVESCRRNFVLQLGSKTRAIVLPVGGDDSDGSYNHFNTISQLWIDRQMEGRTDGHNIALSPVSMPNCNKIAFLHFSGSSFQVTEKIFR